MNAAPRSGSGLGSLAFLLATVAVLALPSTPAFATHCDSCITVVDSCCSRVPHIQDPTGLAGFTAPRAVVETREPDPNTPWPYSVTLYDVTQNIPPENTNWNPIQRYHGPGNSWDGTNLGTVFGVTLDKHGNIYVTHAAVYNSDLTGTGGPGAIYRLDGSTGAISVFATLPNVPDPGVGPNHLPGLGNISYDCDHDQFFVTNMEDGRIYRIKSFNANNASPATVLNFFDPGMPDNGTPGWAPLGDRVWAVQWHGNRVYYSIWATDRCSPAGVNTIRSIALDGSGDFVWFTDQPEISVPSFPSTPGQSAPVSDISFGPNATMLLAERSMCGPTSPGAHQSRVLEYYCEPVPGGGGPWVPSPNIFKPGQIGTQDNAAGGVDYDFTTYDGPSPPATAPSGLGGSQGRVWATSDAIHFGSPHPDIIYGLQAFRPTGGGISTSLLIDSDSNVGTVDKTFIGDVEVPCARSQTYDICGYKFFDQDKDGVHDAGEPLLSGWTIQLSGPVSGTMVTGPSGDFCFTNLPAGTYTVTEVNQPGWIQTAPSGGAHVVTVGPSVSNLAFGNYRCVPDPCVKPPTRMSNWFPLDEPAGPTAHNIIGPSNGAWIGSPLVIPGMVSNALRFPTGADYVAAGPHASLNFGVGDLTLDCWVRSNDSTNTGVRVLLDKRTLSGIGNPTGYSLFMFNNRLAFQLGDGGPVTNWVAPLTSQNLSDGQWHHVAITVVRASTTGGRMYVDGNLVHTFDPTVRPGNTSNSAQLWIAQRIVSGPAPLIGDLDEIELFRRALTAAEVQSIYNARQFGKCKITCYLPSVRTYNAGQNSIVVCFNICNYNWSQPSMTFNWSMAGLPAGGPCTINGPTIFSPSSGTVTVPAGSCVPVCVTIQRPAGLVPGQTACYQLNVNSVGGSGQPGAVEFCCSSTGKLRASQKWIHHDKPSDIVHIASAGTAVSFPMQNINQPAKNFEYKISSVPYEVGPDAQAISLNGLPPGEPVIGTRQVQPDEFFDVFVDVRYVESVKLPLHEIILEADLDGDGVYEESCAIPVMPDNSELVSAPETEGRGELEQSKSYPNPFESNTGVRFVTPMPQKVDVRVFDVNGRVLKTLHEGELRAGAHYLKWDGTDALGKRTEPGIYFIRVEYPGKTLNHKVVRMR